MAFQAIGIGCAWALKHILPKTVWFQAQNLTQKYLKQERKYMGRERNTEINHETQIKQL